MKRFLFISLLMLCSWITLAQENIETISSGTSGDAILRIEADTDNSNEGDNSRIELSQDGGSLKAYLGFNIDWGGPTQPDNLFRIGTRYNNVDNFNRFVINGNNGYTGLGTANPLSLLHMTSLTSGDATLTIEADTDNNNESDNPEIRFLQDGGLVSGFIGFEGQAGTKSAGTLANAFILGSEDLGNTRPVQLIVADQTQMTVNANGVGIGTNTPGYKLDVDGNLRVGKSDAAGITFNRFTSGLTDVPGSVGGMQITGPINSHVVMDIRANDVNDGFYIRIPDVLELDPTVNKTAFAIKANGHIGIGTTDPTHKLSVNGAIRSKEVRCDNDNWPDYVFTDAYKLKSLDEVSQFIAANGHLPNIPSAGEVKTNGFELAKMDASLLEKIEELTLYTIEQQNKLKNQEALIQALIQRIEKLEK
ncbi:MAG: hypothetical protein AAFQ94_09095 [Bacteroidota bacterium]